MKWTLSFVFVLVMGFSSGAQTITREYIAPSATDINLTKGGDYDWPHYMIRSSVDTMHSLVVFLPGTNRQPNNYLYLADQLALMGYHVVGVMYKTDPPINPNCRNTDDVTCHWRARMETIDGTDRHALVTVDVTNSILNRLQKLLQWLVTNRPSGGWDQYYSGGQIQWNKIIVTGHSQGASLSGIIGEEFPVKRVVMFSVIDYLLSGKIPSWVNNSTVGNRYYAFIHPKDEQVPFTYAQIGWEKLGMTQYGSMVNADCNAYPFNNSHILYTSYIPVTTAVDKYHNGTVLDSYMTNETTYKASLKEAIKYLFRK